MVSKVVNHGRLRNSGVKRHATEMIVLVVRMMSVINKIQSGHQEIQLFHFQSYLFI